MKIHLDHFHDIFLLVSHHTCSFFPASGVVETLHLIEILQYLSIHFHCLFPNYFMASFFLSRNVFFLNQKIRSTRAAFEKPLLSSHEKQNLLMFLWSMKWFTMQFDLNVRRAKVICRFGVGPLLSPPPLAPPPPPARPSARFVSGLAPFSLW